MHDLRHALRSLAKSPGFTAVAVVSLALGIGANTAVFSLVNGILLSSLPVPHPQELRVLKWSGVDAKTGRFTGSIDRSGNIGNYRSGSFATDDGQRAIADSFTFPQYVKLREQAAGLAEVLGYTEVHDVNVRARSEPVVAAGLMVADNFFEGLAVRSSIGRLFAAGDDAAGAAPIVVLSDELWTRQYERDPAALGQTITLNGRPFTIVGVASREFRGVDVAGDIQFYVPMSAQPWLMAGWSTTAPDHWWVHLMARIKPDASDAQLQAALDVAFAPMAETVMKAPRVEVSAGRAGPAYDQNNYRQPLVILFGVVGMVILVACANLAGLALARAAARQHEFAVRAALGSGRWRLIRQSLAENLLLATGGAALGLVLAVWGRSGIAQLLAGARDGLRYDLSLDLTVLGFTIGIAFVTALLSGLLPAWRAAHIDPLSGLKSRGALGTPRLGLGRILVVAQIALSVLLLTAAGLYGRTLIELMRIHPGFATDQVLLFRLNPRAAGLRGAAATGFFDRAQEEVAKIPGVRAVALTQYKLLGGSMSGGSFFTLPAHPELIDQRRPSAHRLDVSETFFSALEIPLLLGRGFTAGDVKGAPKVVVVNQTFVRSYFPAENPIGQSLKIGDEAWQIIGVSGDAQYTQLKGEPPPTVYFSHRQSGTSSAYLAVRTSRPPPTLVMAARKAIAAVDPAVPLTDITTQAAVRDQQISQERMFATLVGALAALAVLLCCVGIYGLMAYNVARRTSEIGLRMAIGAQKHDIAVPILREALALAGFGVAIGVPTALGLAQIIASQLYGVAPRDPVTLAIGALVLVAVAALAAWIPARRAARVDPLIALRTE